MSDITERGKTLSVGFTPFKPLFRLLRPLLTARPFATQTQHDAGKRRCLARGQRPDFGRCAQLYGLDVEKTPPHRNDKSAARRESLRGCDCRAENGAIPLSGFLFMRCEATANNVKGSMPFTLFLRFWCQKRQRNKNGASCHFRTIYRNV